MMELESLTIEDDGVRRMVRGSAITDDEELLRRYTTGLLTVTNLQASIDGHWFPVSSVQWTEHGLRLYLNSETVRGGRVRLTLAEE